MNRAKEQGQRATCLNSVKQLTLAWILYAQDNEDRIVNASTFYSRTGEPALRPATLANRVLSV